MDAALTALFFQGDVGVHPVGTDGTVVLSAGRTDGTVRRSQEKVNESIFTAFYTAFFSTVFQRRMKKEILLWMSSTGILHVTLQWKNIIDGLYLKCVHQPASMVKRQALQLILEEGKVMDGSEDLPKASDSSFTGK